MTSVVSHKQLELFFSPTGSRQCTARLDFFQGLFAMGKFLHDGCHGLRPDERVGVCISSHQISFNGSNELSDTDEDATTYAFSGQFSKPALYQIQPA